MGDVTARDRVHIGYCRDDQCVVEYDDPGRSCKQLDDLLDLMEAEAGGQKKPAGRRGKRMVIPDEFTQDDAPLGRDHG